MNEHQIAGIWINFVDHTCQKGSNSFAVSVYMSTLRMKITKQKISATPKYPKTEDFRLINGGLEHTRYSSTTTLSTGRRLFFAYTCQMRNGSEYSHIHKHFSSHSYRFFSIVEIFLLKDRKSKIWFLLAVAFTGIQFEYWIVAKHFFVEARTFEKLAEKVLKTYPN